MTIGDLRYKQFPVLDQGFVALVDVMGDDHAICDAARISYGKGTRSVSDDRNLIRYLMRCRHTSPFEQAELKFLVRCPMDCWRQWIRHRMASVNEYSTRYSEAIDAKQTTQPDQWRLQSATNKQGSGGFVTEWPEGWGVLHDVDYDEEDDKFYEGNGSFLIQPGGWKRLSADQEYSPGEFLAEREKWFHDTAKGVYEERLAFGVAREQARKDLPLSTYTEAYWKIDLHNLLHFLGLRMDAHAQKEIRDYATIIGREIVAPLFPLTWEAFEDYRLNAMNLTALDVAVIREIQADGRDPESALGAIANQREQGECRAKLVRLGIIPSGEGAR